MTSSTASEFAHLRPLRSFVVMDVESSMPAEVAGGAHAHLHAMRFATVQPDPRDLPRIIELTPFAARQREAARRVMKAVANCEMTFFGEPLRGVLTDVPVELDLHGRTRSRRKVFRCLLEDLQALPHLVDQRTEATVVVPAGLSGVRVSVLDEPRRHPQSGMVALTIELELQA